MGGVWKSIATALLLSACVNIPAFQGDKPPADANGDGPIDVPPLSHVCGEGELRAEQQGSGAATHEVVCGPNYTMHFSPDGAHFPYSWRINGREVLSGAFDASDCQDERGVGVAAFPATLFNGMGPTANTTFEYEYAGPAVVKIRLSYAATPSCGNTTFTGYTRLAFFPDGRMAQYDHFESNSAIDATNCTCAQAWYMTSYWVFADDASVALLGTNKPAINTEHGIAASHTCIGTPQYNVALRWINALAPRVRNTHTTGTPAVGDTLAFVADMTSEHATMQPQRGEGYESFTMMWVDPASHCADDRLAPYAGADPRDLRVTFINDDGSPFFTRDQPVRIGSDGIWGGDKAAGGSDIVEVGPATKHIVRFDNVNAGPGSDNPAGFALNIAFAADGDQYVVTRGGDGIPTEATLVPNADYILQRNTTPLDTPTSGSHVQIWFKDALASNQYVQVRIVSP